MDSRHQTRIEPVSTTHPGETVLDYLAFHHWSQSELARRTGVTPKTISEICNGKAPISPTTALALEKVFHRPAHFWLNLQRNFSEAMAREGELAKASDWDEWARRFPLGEMKKLQFSLSHGRSDAHSLLRFFGVSSPETWQSVWASANVAYRQTLRFETSEESIAAWVRETEIEARGFDVEPFDERKLLATMGDLRQLTRRRIDEALGLLQGICAGLGVAVVVVPGLPHTGISGCTRWLGDKRVVIGLTLRYKTDDQIWFTFFHELGHVLLHRQARPFVVDNAARDLADKIVDPEMQKLEMEANQFASDTLIPPGLLGDFVREGVFTTEAIYDFADTAGVGPGIVVGRLQYAGILGRHQGNKLKQRLHWQLKARA